MKAWRNAIVTGILLQATMLCYGCAINRGAAAAVVSGEVRSCMAARNAIACSSIEHRHIMAFAA